MTRIEALKQLADKVEVGEATYDDFHALAVTLLGFYGRAFEAYSDGSLDGAKALHEAVLPGWDYIVARTNSGLTAHAQVGPDVTEFDDNPARAWLLAILKALIAEEGE